MKSTFTTTRFCVEKMFIFSSETRDIYRCIKHYQTSTIMRRHSWSAPGQQKFAAQLASGVQELPYYSLPRLLR